MLNIASLKEARASKTDAIRAIIAKAENEKRDLTELELGAFDTGKGELEKLEKDLGRAEFLAEMERRMDGGMPVGNADKRFEVECRSYSLLRAIASQVPGLNVDAGRELEISRELERRAGFGPPQGLLVPMTVFEKRAPADIVSTGLPAAGPGSNIIATDYRPDQFIDILRVAMRVRSLGARVLTGLIGNLDIPKLKASATAFWVRENDAITQSDAQFDKVSLTPKHVGALIEISRNMLLQSSPDVEGIIRDDFAQLLASALDRAAILGGGSDEPSGILASGSGVTVVDATDAAALTYLNVIGCITAVAGSNALQGSLGFLTNSGVVSAACTTLKDAADTASSFIMPNPGAGTLAGYPLAMSNNVPSDLSKGAHGGTDLSALIFGDWSQLIIGYWSAFDLLVNPYETTAYTKGNVQVRGMLTADIKIRQPKAFAVLDNVDL
jgi:HK97 family phage major capsid protein